MILPKYKPLDIKGYENIYGATSNGRIYSFRRKKFLAQNANRHGYMMVHLCVNCKERTVSVHRLIAETFIPNPYGLPEINHIDENKSNNHANNLEWCDRKYNINYGTARERAIEKMKGKKQVPEHIEKRKMVGSKNPAYGKPGHFKGKQHTEETKKKLSEQRKGKNISGENPNAKKVIDTETNIVYECIKDASDKNNINYSTLKLWIRKDKSRFKYLEEGTK